MFTKKKKIILTIIILTIISIIFFTSHTKYPKSEELDLSCNKCNLIFLNIELLRADRVGLLNPNQKNTPYIDEFFNNSIIFENAISPSGLTYISNLAIITSTEVFFNRHNPIYPANDGKLIIDYIPIIPEVLREKGYTTLGINVGNILKEVDPVSLMKRYNQNNQKIPELFNSVSDVIRRYKKQSPFFIHYRPSFLHYPYKRSINDLDTRKSSRYSSEYYGNIIELSIPPTSNTRIVSGPYNTTNKDDVKYKVIVNNISMNLTNSDIELVNNAYNDQIRYIDSKLKEIFKELDQIQNTIVVLYANHGEGLFDNGIPNHGVGYQSNVHVPLIIKHPKIKEQIRIKKRISLIDFIPTLYEMLNISIKHKNQGISLVPLIKNGQYNRTYIYVGQRDHYGGLESQYEIIIKEDLKLYEKRMGISELYNLSIDPKELNNIFFSSNDSQVNQLKIQLEKIKIESLEFRDEMKEYIKSISQEVN
jgi:membrane-anchored protein YejM (alkaline phosphatase superfamily)